MVEHETEKREHKISSFFLLWTHARLNDCKKKLLSRCCFFGRKIKKSPARDRAAHENLPWSERPEHASRFNVRFRSKGRIGGQILSSWVKTRVSEHHITSQTNKTIKNSSFYLHLQHVCLIYAILHAGRCHKTFNDLFHFLSRLLESSHRSDWEMTIFRGCLLILLPSPLQFKEFFVFFGSGDNLFQTTCRWEKTRLHCLRLLDLYELLLPSSSTFNRNCASMISFQFDIESSAKRDSFCSRKTFKTNAKKFNSPEHLTRQIRIRVEAQGWSLILKIYQ